MGVSSPRVAVGSGRSGRPRDRDVAAARAASEPVGVLRVDGLRALIDHAGEGWFVRPEDRALLVAPLDATARRDLAGGAGVATRVAHVDGPGRNVGPRDVVRRGMGHADGRPGNLLMTNRSRREGTMPSQNWQPNGAMRPTQVGCWRRCRRVLMGALAMLAAQALWMPSPARAVPSFARQTGMPCTACHTSFPSLTPFGRWFKLNGYVMHRGGENR